MMKKRQTNKKGFTIVELVIVIAVIAILAGVLIPTFINVINKTRLTADKTLVKNLNDQISLYIAENGKDSLDTMHDAVDVLEDNGIVLGSLKLESGKKLAWDSNSGYFVLFDADNSEVTFIGGTIGDETCAVDTANNPNSEYKAMDFFIVTTASEYAETPNSPFSIYAKGDNWGEITGGVVTCAAGFDMGDVTEITKITYNNNKVSQTVVIRTNAFTTELEIDAPMDTVKHYGYAGIVNVIRVADASYEEYGTVGRLITTNSEASGHLNIKEGATVFQIEQDSNNENTSVSVVLNSRVFKSNGEPIDTIVARNQTICSDTLDYNTCTHEHGTTCVSDSKYLYEFCNCCGYTVVTVNDTLKRTKTDEYGKYVATAQSSYYVDNLDEDTTIGSVYVNLDQETVPPVEVDDGNETTYCTVSLNDSHSFVYTLSDEKDADGRYMHTITCSNGNCSFHATQRCDLNDEGKCKYCGRSFDKSYAYSLDNKPIEVEYTANNNGEYTVSGEDIAEAEHIVLPEYVTKIADNGLSEATNLRNLVVPQTLTDLGSYIFRDYSVAHFYDPDTGTNSTNSSSNADANTKLKSVTFETDANGYSNLTSISASVFTMCVNLSEITLPKSVTKIESNAFEYCYSLKEIDLTYVTEIEDNAFSVCFGLETVKLGKDLIKIGNYAFNKCCNLKNIDFSKCTALVNLGIYIDQSNGSDVFTDCYSLEEVDLSNCTSLTTIETGVFKNCSSLCSVKLPNSITIIRGAETGYWSKYGAFYNCENLYDIVIPASVETIGTNAFNCTPNLREYTDLRTNPTLIKSGIVMKSSENQVTDYKKVGDFIMYDDGNATPVLVDYIGDKTTEIVLPTYSKEYEVDNELLNYIQDFNIVHPANNESYISKYNCVEKVTISENVKNINTQLFGAILRLEEVVVAANNDYYTSCDGVLYNKDKTELILCPNQKEELVVAANITTLKQSYFNIKYSKDVYYKYPNLTKVSFEQGSNLEEIGDDAFNSIANVASIDLSNCTKLTKIGTYAFCYTDITAITIPGTVTSYGYMAFSSCYNLTEVTIEEGTEDVSFSYESKMFQYSRNLTTVNLPDNFNNFKYQCFTHSDSAISGITSITIPSGVTNIDPNAFAGLTGLINIDCSKNSNFTFEDGILYNQDKTQIILILSGSSNLVIPSTITTLQDNLFKNNKTLESITIPASVTSIGINAFASCSNLATVTFASGSTLNSIGAYAFSGCTSLTEITIPASVTSIGNNAFASCVKLATVTYASGINLTSIQANTFSGCTSLPEINIPVSVETIGTGAYSGCTKITTINTNGNTHFTLNGGILYDSEMNMLFVLPNVTNVELPESVEKITASLFKGFTTLVTITIPASVKTIESNAFQNCTSLTTVTFASGSNLESIGASAFSGCKALTTINLSNCTKLTTINGGAFLNCKALTTIDLANCTNISTIAANAFGLCTSLASIKLVPSILPAINNIAFRGCNNLETIEFNGTKAGWESAVVTNWKKSAGLTYVKTIKCSNGDLSC